MPTATDLVTDLPADFEVFGQAVDSSMADLKGGTTGQILSKATNTDMDFTWITNDVGDITAVTASTPLTGGGTSGAITVGIQDASTSQKGSVQLSDSTSTTSSILAATPTAVKSAYDLANTASTQIFTNTRAAGKNAVINGGMDIWQRGTSFANTGANIYTADRWQSYTNAASTVSRQTTSDTTNLPDIQYCAKVQRTAASTSVATQVLQYSQESVNSIPFAGKTVTFSFYAKAGANFSPTSSLLNYYLVTGTGTDQNIGGTYTGALYPINTTATLTTTWQRFTATATLSSSLTELAFYFSATPTGTAGANDWYQVTGIQLELGSTATSFSRTGSNYGGELALCQRYFQALTGTNEGVFNCNYYTTVNPYGVLSLKQTMRIAPTLTASSSSALVILAGAVQKATTAISLSASATDQVEVTATTAASTTGYGAWARFNGANSYLQFSAEL